MKSLNIRDFPEDLMVKLKVEAARRGMTLRDFAIAVLRITAGPGRQEPKFCHVEGPSVVLQVEDTPQARSLAKALGHELDELASKTEKAILQNRMNPSPERRLQGRDERRSTRVFSTHRQEGKG